MAMIDYLFYVGNLSYSVRKGSKNDNAGEEEGDEGEEWNYFRTDIYQGVYWLTKKNSMT